MPDSRVYNASRVEGAIGLYEHLEFGPIPAERPFTLIDMIATIDGKTVSGDRDQSVNDLGSQRDHELLKRLEKAVDAVLVGGQTLRATGTRWNPGCRVRVALSGSGKLPFSAAFFTGGEGYMATTQEVASPPESVGLIQAQDLAGVVSHLRKEMGVERLLILGGSETNAQFLAAGLVDELFLTIAPKVKLGRDLPTYAGGEALPRERLLAFELAEHHVVADEVFLRYRRQAK